MNDESMKEGDVVAIRGDKRINYSRRCCCYTPDQLVDGKYLKHTRTGEIWTGVITKINGDMVKIGSGGWWFIDLVEVITRLEDIENDRR